MQNTSVSAQMLAFNLNEEIAEHSPLKPEIRDEDVYCLSLLFFIYAETLGSFN